MVTHIDDKGFLRFGNIGGVNPAVSLGQRVYFENGTFGVIGSERIEDPKDLKLEKLYIDIGARDRQEALARVRVGQDVYKRQKNTNQHRGSLLAMFFAGGERRLNAKEFLKSVSMAHGVSGFEFMNVCLLYTSEPEAKSRTGSGSIPITIREAVSVIRWSSLSAKCIISTSQPD